MMVGFGFIMFSATFNNITVITWPQKYEDDLHKSSIYSTTKYNMGDFPKNEDFV
jgi:hypothetical protein